MKPISKKITKWVIYDGRYHSDPDRASIAEICDSEKEAKKRLKQDWPKDYVIVEEDMEAYE